MQAEITQLYDLEVYTHKGIYLGRINEVLLDLNKSLIYELILIETNPNIIDESRSIGVPFRWVQSVSEVVVLKYFPGKIHIKPRLARYRKKRRKKRVLKHSWGSHGISRLPWNSRQERRYAE